MKFWLSILIVCSILKVFGQVQDSSEVFTQANDSLLINTHVEVDSSWFKKLPRGIGNKGIYIETNLLEAPGPKAHYLVRSWGGGVTYNRFNFGGFVSNVSQEYHYRLIFPNIFSMSYRYGGIYIGSYIFRENPFEVDLRMNLGKGDIVWSRLDNGENLLRDEFVVYYPEILLVYVPITYLKVFLSGSYRIVKDLNIQKIDSNDLQGFMFGFGLKLGLYR